MLRLRWLAGRPVLPLASADRFQEPISLISRTKEEASMIAIAVKKKMFIKRCVRLGQVADEDYFGFAGY